MIFRACTQLLFGGKNEKLLGMAAQVFMEIAEMPEMIAKELK